VIKGQIALDLLDQARVESWPGRVVADSGFGICRPFRRERGHGACGGTTSIYRSLGLKSGFSSHRDHDVATSPPVKALSLTPRPRSSAKLSCNPATMIDPTGTLLSTVSHALKRRERHLRRLKIQQRNIPRILKQLPSAYWSDLDGNNPDYVSHPSDPAPENIILRNPGLGRRQRYRVLRPVRLDGDRGKLQITDPGLVVASNGRFYAYRHVAENVNVANRKERYEVEISGMRPIDPSVEDLRVFERSLLPFLEALIRPEREGENSATAADELNSSFIVRSVKKLVAAQPLEAVEKLLSLAVKLAAFLGFLIVTLHLTSLGYFPAVSSVGLAQIYFAIVGAALIFVVLSMLQLYAPFVSSRMLYTAGNVIARPGMWVGITISQLGFLFVSGILGREVSSQWIQIIGPSVVLGTFCVVIALVGFIGDDQSASWVYRAFFILLWAVSGLLAPMSLCRPTLGGMSSWLQTKAFVLAGIWVLLLGFINWCQEHLVQESSWKKIRTPVYIGILVGLIEVLLANPVVIAFRALGLGYLTNQRIYVDGPGRDQIYLQTQSRVTPLKSQMPDRWYLDRIEILSKIGDPVLVSIPMPHDDALRGTLKKAVQLPLKDLISYDVMPAKLKTGQLPPG
jgi:hypothetical protein